MKQTVPSAQLAAWAIDTAGLPLWLFHEANSVVGDAAETAALIVPRCSQSSNLGLADWIARVRALARMGEEARRHAVSALWAEAEPAERIVLNKLLTGGFRSPFSPSALAVALSQVTGRTKADIAYRLSLDWSPASTSFATLFPANDPQAEAARPYPLHLPAQLQAEPDGLGDAADWMAEWQADGVPCQLVLRQGSYHLWSPQNDLITGRFPELAAASDFLPPGTVLLGDLVASKDGAALPFAALERRAGLKRPGAAAISAAPVIMIPADLLEYAGADLRSTPYGVRRDLLDQALHALPRAARLQSSQRIAFASWPELAAIRSLSTDAGRSGIRLKQRAAPYGPDHSGWLWRSAPATIMAVLLYAPKGPARHDGPPADFTFAVWEGGNLVPVARTSAGLSEVEREEILAWAIQNTTARFGPLLQVTAGQLFELAFDGIRASPRHRSQVVLRHPRILKWHRDTNPGQADRLANVQARLAAPSSPGR